MTCREWTPVQWDKCRELTRRGKFRQILTIPQRRFYDMFRQHPEYGEYGLYCTRKIGKTFTVVVLGYELSMEAPRIGRIILPELKLAKEIVYPIIDEMKQFMHRAHWPRLYKSTNTLEFANGSKIILGGAHPDNVDGNRGPMAHWLAFDEEAFWDKRAYMYAIDSVFYPQLTLTNGPVFHTSTPPEDMDHPFILNTLPRLRALNAVEVFTVDDNPLLSKEDIERIASRLGGRKSKSFRREYLCEEIPETSRLVCPEFDEARHVIDIPYDRTDYFGRKVPYIGYASADLGVVDFTGILTGYYDHNAEELVIVGEKLLQGQSLRPIVEAYNGLKESTLWHCVDVVETIDTWEQTRLELMKEYGLRFRRPIKTDIVDNIAIVRNAFELDKIKINADCKELIRQLSLGVWKVSDGRKQFERSETMGHLDLVAALCYLVRSVNWKRRPGVSNIKMELRRPQ